ncbi:MAG: HPF/RaiA family ribosome-associated protein [Chloroflexi bacterium]|nr:HPF/RaiA family ribosome-associated protein [Chloroflexota bacterium]
MLQLQVKPGPVALTPEVNEYIRERAARLDSFYDTILTCRVILDAPTGHHRQGGPFEVRIDLDVPGSVLAVTKQRADNLHVAVRQAFAAAERRLEDYARKQRGDVKTPETPPRGKISRIFPQDGYGFIATPDGREVYFHRNSVLADGFDRLAAGTEVRFAEEEGDKGPQASTVAPAGD